MPVLSLILLACLQAPSRETVSIPDTKLRFDLVAIPGGKAVVGEEKPREIELRPFRMAVREVTWAEFNRFRNGKDLDAVTRPSNADNYFGDAGIPPEFLENPRPLTNVRWHSAIMYCEWLSRKTGRLFRLPTETEWEYAARAGSDKPLPEALDDVAWHKGNSKGQTHVGGGKKPNAFGLEDMTGNVWEYALEPFAPHDYGPVLRGGCWSSTVRDLRYSARQSIPLKWMDSDSNLPRSVWWLTTNTVSIGFRVVEAADASDVKEREAYASKIECTVSSHREKTIKTGGSSADYREVKGEIRNRGSRALDEVELMVFYVADGKPHLIDQHSNKPQRGVFSKCWPVLVNSALDELRGKPLEPGGVRPFQVDLPLSGDIENQADPKFTMEGKATAVRFSR
jgi:formylglycine-generating enzyme required for sulfatase activity